LLKEQGSYNLVQFWGHRGPVLRPRCIGPGGARTPFIFLFYSIPQAPITSGNTANYNKVTPQKAIITTIKNK